MNDSTWQSYGKIRRQERKDYILSKKDRPCADCGQSYPNYVMDFHHLDEESKNPQLKKRGKQHQSMSKVMAGWSLKRIDKELDGCVVLCANCHRMRHGPP